METKVIVISPDALSLLFQPILDKIENIEKILSGKQSEKTAVYTDEQASQFLKISKKKLQQLRNSREIGFVRQNRGRRILYRHEHLMEYLQGNELKKRK